MNKKYKNVIKYDNCAQKHETNRYNKDEIKIIQKCINCEQTKH